MGNVCQGESHQQNNESLQLRTAERKAKNADGGGF